MKRLTRQYIGSVSWGTLVAEDLCETYISFLESVSRECQIVGRVKRLRVEWEDIKTRAESCSYHSSGVSVEGKDAETLDWIVGEDLTDLLMEIAPAGCYFGATEGDGADFGFWSDPDDYAD